MARDPGSIWKPLPEAGAPDGYTKTQFIVHSTGTMASAAANWNYFLRSDVVVESTFIVGWGPEDPTLQIMDSTDNADANGSANQRGISVEVVGDGVGGYNAWQVGELVRLGRWAKATHGILPRVIPSEPSGGFGWHVMFGAPGPWTTVRGKVCPGAARIQQLKTTVFPAIFGGTSVATQEDTVSMEEVVQSWYGPRFKDSRNYAQVVHNIEDQIVAANTQIAGLSAAVAKLAAAVASGSDDLTAADLTDAVDEGIRRGGAAVLAAQEAARQGDPT